MSQEIVAAYRLSPQQKRLWLLRESCVAARAEQCAILIEGALKRELLRQAVAQVVERHEILRTTFAPLPGVKVPVQVVAESSTLSWHEVDLTGESLDNQPALLERHYKAERLHLYDLENETPARVSLLTLSGNRHVLTLALPSLCADSQTLDNLLPEVARCYEACANGDYLETEEIVQYKQFSEWQNELLEGAEDEAAAQFWRTLEAKAVPAPPLPWEKSPREISRSEPSVLTLELQTEVAAQVAAVARRHAVTTEVVLLACWQTLLWLLTKQEVIATHVLCHGRVYEEMSEALGAYEKWPFIQTNCEEDFHFTDILAQVSESVAQAREWQEYYSTEQSSVAGESDSVTVQEILPYGFVSESRPASVDVCGVKFSLVQKQSGTERFRLKLESLLEDERPSLAFHYDPAFYTTETVQRLAAYYQTVVRSVLTDQRVKLGSLELLGEAERQLLLREWNDTRGEYPHEQCLHELFEAQAARTPEALAVVYQNERLTFRELDERANRLANYLRRRGVSEDVPIALLLERSVETIVGVLGILKAGGAFVPLDPAHPSQRLSFMLEDTRAPVVLTQERLLKSLPEQGAKTVCLDTGWAEISRESAQAPQTNVTSDHLAYIIYTSGSTGRAKGVSITHRSVVNLSGALRQSVYAGQATPMRVSVNASLSFDSSIKQVVQLLQGHSLHLIPEEVRPDGEALLAFVREHRLDVLDCTPSQLSLLIAAGLTEAGSTLKLVLVGGEALNAATWKLLAEQTGIVFYNVYGPTECTVDATVCRISGDSAQPVIGRAIRNVRVYILDGRMRPVPMGVAGELYIGGDGVARGYHGRAELTAERFVPDALSGERGGRLYRTGDVARYVESGEIEFLGRVDEQVKVRGFRIELGEIEAVLRAQPSVRDGVVVCRESEGGEKRLVAYVVSGGVGGAELRGYVREQLPEYMVPAAIVSMDALPLTPNGKVDRRALATLEVAATEEECRRIAPRTPVEEMLAGIWAEVLNTPQLSVDSNFFDLGGHSLLATQVVSRVRSAFRIDLPLRSLFESPTVESLSAHIEGSLKSGGEQTGFAIERVPRDGGLPLSFAQQRLWFLDQLMPGTTVYNVPTVLRLSGQLNLRAFEQALGEVLRRHEILRTTFAMQNGTPVQIIAPPAALNLPLFDLRGLTEPERAAEVESRVSHEMGQPFDLSRGPLLRATLLRLEAEEHVLLFTLHHIVSDDWSKGVLVREVAALYEAFSGGLPSPLPEPSIQYADYAQWQRRWMSGEVLESQLNYWKRQLSGDPPVLQLPTDHPRPATQSFRGAHEPVRLSPELTEKLKSLSRQEGATLFMTLLAAFKTLLYHYANQEDIVVGTPIANRTRAEIEDLIGFFVNTLVLRTDFSGNPTFRQLLARVREVTLGAYTHQDLPFEKLVEELQLNRDPGRTPLFQVVFTLQNAPMPPLELLGLTLTTQPVESGTAKFDLVLNMADTEQGLAGWLEYNCDLFEAATVARMREHFERLLNSIVAQPDAQLDDLEILTSEEALLLERTIHVEEFEDSFFF